MLVAGNITQPQAEQWFTDSLNTMHSKLHVPADAASSTAKALIKPTPHSPVNLNTEHLAFIDSTNETELSSQLQFNDEDYQAQALVVLLDYLFNEKMAQYLDNIA